jgi:hypothetical protein
MTSIAITNGMREEIGGALRLALSEIRDYHF